MNAVYKIDWTEYERGWGQRPDGTPYHKTKEDADKYVKDFIVNQPKGAAPDVYVSPGVPMLVEVDQETYDRVQLRTNTWK